MVCECVHMSASAHRSQRGTRAPEAGVTADCELPVSVLGTELMSSASGTPCS